MNSSQIMKMFEETAYIRVSGTQEELRAAEYLKAKAEALGVKAWLEHFPVGMAKIEKAELTADGGMIPCKGYKNASTARIEAPLCYLPSMDDWSLSTICGKIVMVDGYMRYWMYQDLIKYGAAGFITYSGDANYADREIDQRELRDYVHQGNRIPGVNINAKDAIEIIRRGTKTVCITLEQEEYPGQSQNVVAELPGERPEWIVFTAHYDTTSLSQGAYDNMSGCIGLLALAEYFAAHPHKYSLRFIWCGSEERGLRGSKAWCAQHKDELESVVLNINLDMIGSIMGKFIFCVSAEDKLCHYLEYFGQEMGFGITGKQDVYPSDSTPFADAGVPAVSLARCAAHNTATIHNSYDTMAVMSGSQMVEDIAFITAFADRMANASRCPVSRTIPQTVKDKLDIYLNRKRAE